MNANKDTMGLPRHVAAATLLAISLIAGCGTTQEAGTVPPESLPRFQRIAAVSLVADRMHFNFNGVTVFSNGRDRRSIVDWGVDPAYEDQLAEAASKVFKASVVRAPHEASTFAAVNDPAGGAGTIPNWVAIEGPIKAWCAENALDAVLVVAKTASYPAKGNADDAYSAQITVSQPQNLSVMTLHANVGLIDCTTGKVVAVQELFDRERGGGFGLGKPGLKIDLPKNMARAPFTQTWKPAVRAHLIALPIPAWEGSLRAMLPPSTAR